MNLAALAAAAALRLLDPTGDAAGDGNLMPPTSPAYANAAVFDLQEVAVTSDEAGGQGGTLSVAMGSVERSESLPAGFNRVVVDVYLEVAEGGAEATMAGPALLMPPGRGWDYAVRISPRGAFGTVAPLDAEAPAQWEPLPLEIVEDVFLVSLPWALPDEVEVYAVSGLFDAFDPTDWRSLTTSPSPWAFSSETQVAPVIDLLAPDQAAQTTALQDGVLPAPTPQRSSGLPWLALATGGVLVALGGLWLRRLVPTPAEAVVDEPAPAGAEIELEGEEPTADDQPIDDPPLEEPPSEVPPHEEPPVDDPPVEDPPADEPEPPVEDPPRDQRPRPPVEAPPADDGAVRPAEAPPVDDDAPPVEAPPADEPQPAEEARPRARRLVIDLTDASWSEGDEEGGDDLSGFVATSARRSEDLPVASADEES